MTDDLFTPEIRDRLVRLSNPEHVRQKCDRVFQLKIVVTGLEWPLWRRFQVSGICTFWDLYVVMNNLLLWEFTGVTTFTLIEPEEMQTTTLNLDSVWHERVDRYLSPEHPISLVTMAKWLIVLQMEAVLDASEGKAYPLTLAGEGGAPDSDWVGPVVLNEVLLKTGAQAPPSEWAFDPADIVFDDPDDIWIHNYCELPVMTDVLHDLVSGKPPFFPLPDGRYPIKFPARSRDLLLKHQVASPELLAGTVEGPAIPGFVTLALTKGDLDNLVGAIAMKISESEDVRFHRRLQQVDWYLQFFQERLEKTSSA